MTWTTSTEPRLAPFVPSVPVPPNQSSNQFDNLNSTKPGNLLTVFFSFFLLRLHLLGLYLNIPDPIDAQPARAPYFDPSFYSRSTWAFRHPIPNPLHPYYMSTDCLASSCHFALFLFKPPPPRGPFFRTVQIFSFLSSQPPLVHLCLTSASRPLLSPANTHPTTVTTASPQN
jgi:hypothetical protein